MDEAGQYERRIADLRAEVVALWADPRERTVESKIGYVRGYNQAIREVLRLIDAKTS